MAAELDKGHCHQWWVAGDRAAVADRWDMERCLPYWGTVPVADV